MHEWFMTDNAACGVHLQIYNAQIDLKLHFSFFYYWLQAFPIHTPDKVNEPNTEHFVILSMVNKLLRKRKIGNKAFTKMRKFKLQGADDFTKRE